MKKRAKNDLDKFVKENSYNNELKDVYLREI